MTKSKKPQVAILIGSENDLPLLSKGIELFKKFGVAFEVELSSAHRTPDRTARYAREAEGRGLKVLIGAAGFANHLAGVLAAHTPLPVIGIPLDSSPLNGLDSLLATVQMPAGVPVATVTIGKAGGVNAALLALQILGTADPEIRQAIRAHKEEMAQKVEQRSEALRKSS